MIEKNTDFDNDAVLSVAVKAGSVILQNGGETYRVEDTIKRICQSYDKQSESFVTPTGIIVSLTDRFNRTVSRVLRIKDRSIDLNKISLINHLSRQEITNRTDLDTVNTKLDSIMKAGTHNLLFKVILSAFISFFFTLVFGGTYPDAMVSFVNGVLISSSGYAVKSVNFDDFFKNVICGAIAAFTACLAVFIGLPVERDIIIIGSIMLLVPGIAITNAIRDTMAGDLLAGISKGFEAVFVAVSIAIGTGFILKIDLIMKG